MTKRRRLNDIDNIDSERLLDSLDEIPFIYRSIQGVVYMKENPFVASETNYIECAISYICHVVEKSFKGCGFYHAPEELKIEKDRADLMIGTPVKESDFNVNFSLFMSFAQKMIHKELRKINPLIEVSFRGEGSWMNFAFRTFDDEISSRIFSYCDDRVSERPINSTDI